MYFVNYSILLVNVVIPEAPVVFGDFGVGGNLISLPVGLKRVGIWY